MNRRGLTLLEVLAAAALLAMSAAAFVPLLVGAVRILNEQPRVEADELGHLADQVLREPEAFGVTKTQLLDGGSFDVHLLNPEISHVRVAAMESSTEEKTGTWLIFTKNEAHEKPVIVLRWIDASPDEEGHP